MENDYFNENEFIFNKNYSISASAGTGKTYSIVKIVAKLLENGIKEDELLIVTYTEKAAGELKDRIKKDIPEFNIDNSHIGTIHSFCKDTISEFYFTMGLPKDLNVVDDSKIQSLYDKFIRDSLYDGSIELKMLKNKDGNDKGEIKDIVNKLYLDKDYNIVPEIVSFEQKTYYENYLNNLSTLVGKNHNEIIDFFLEFNDSSDIEFSNQVHEVFLVFKGEGYYQELIDNISLCDSTMSNLEEIRQEIGNKRKLTELEKQNKETYENAKKDKTKYEEIINQINKLKNSLFDNISNTGNFNYSFKGQKINDILEPIKKLKELYSKKTIICNFEESAIELYKKWQELKRHNKWFSFNDMLREVREAVLSIDNSLKEKLSMKYKYALIDEFQDTNQIQWDIFKTIFLDNENNHIIVVGDRKQSIYSFQGADLTVYDSAVRAIEEKGGLLKVLPKNYRSSKASIDSYNRLFKVEKFNSLDYREVGIGLEQLDARFDGKSIKGISVVAKKDKESLELSSVTPFEYAQMIVKMITDYCMFDENGKTRLQLIDKKGNSNNVSFKDFMILGRTRSEFNSIEYELKKVGIPYVKYKDNKLFGGIECNHWIALINAILIPDFTGNNRNIFRKALFTKFFDKSLNEISSPYYDRDSTLEMELILKWKNLAGEYKYIELINSIIEDSKIESRMSTLTDIQSLNVFKQIGDYSLEYLLDGNSLYDLKNHLIKLNNGESDDEEGSSIVEKGTDFDCVELMTMHASKGLDRAIVFSVGGEKQKNNMMSVGIYHQKDNDNNIRAYLTMDKDKYNDEINKEFDRLFYVAYTRHKYLLVLPYYKNNKDVEVSNATIEFINSKDNEDYFSIEEYDYHKINLEEIKANIKTIIKANTNENETIIEKNRQLDILKNISKNMNKHNLYKHSYASMSKINEDNIVLDDNLNSNKEGNELEENLSGFDKSGISLELNYSNIDPIQIPDLFPKGAAIGTTLHEIFENFEFTSINNNNNLLEVISDRFNANNIKNKDSFIEYVANIVYNVLNASLPIINGNKIDTSNSFKLCEIPSVDRKAEAEFNFGLENVNLSNYCNGFIDLLFRRGDYFSILDWKSDTINDNDLLSYNNYLDIKKRVDGHYSIQRVLYSYTLVNWLYSSHYADSLDDAFNNHFGGIYYVFIRGCKEDTPNGIYAETWSCYNDLKKEFDYIMNKILYGGKSNE